MRQTRLLAHSVRHREGDNETGVPPLRKERASRRDNAQKPLGSAFEMDNPEEDSVAKEARLESRVAHH